MTTRAIIHVRGDVQETGYRALVRRTARKLRLVGFVENLPDGRVRIVCEGGRETIEELCKNIRKKDGFATITSIRKRFYEPKGELKGFAVKTEDLVSEIFQGYSTAGRYFENLEDKTDRVGDKVESVGTEVKGVGKKVESVDDGIKSMNRDMNKRFGRLDESYGEFTSKMDSLDNHIKEIRDDFRVLVKHVVARSKEGSSS
ncbi:MAG: acylphosphatase [Thermoplasmata archaeon]|nr:acylphosphatase [Thermoplasmata archaeon]